MKERVFRVISKLLIISMFLGVWSISTLAYAYSVPTSPIVLGPASSTISHSFTPSVSLTAAANAEILVYEGSTVVGRGVSNVPIPLTLTGKGVHELTAKAVVGTLESVETRLPLIIVDDNATFDIADVAAVASQMTGQTWDFYGGSYVEDKDALYRRNVEYLLNAIQPKYVFVYEAIEGIVTDGKTGEKFGGLALKFRTGADNVVGNVYTAAITNSDGAYSVEMAPGTYTVEMSGVGYETTFRTQTLFTGQNHDNNLVAVHIPEKTRIELTWGTEGLDAVRDLDAHLIGPNPDPEKADNGFHISYMDKVLSWNNVQYGNLDTDSTIGGGPEIITMNAVTQQVYGTYTFYVNNYSGESSLSHSKAIVKLFTGNSEIPFREYTVPTTGALDEYWNVFNMVIERDGSVHFVDNNRLQISEPYYRPVRVSSSLTLNSLDSLTEVDRTSVLVGLTNNSLSGLTKSDFSVSASVYNSKTGSKAIVLNGLAYNDSTKVISFNPVEIAAGDQWMEITVGPSASHTLYGLPVRRIIMLVPKGS